MLDGANLGGRRGSNWEQFCKEQSMSAYGEPPPGKEKGDLSGGNLQKSTASRLFLGLEQGFFSASRSCSTA